jgi:Nickel responsive protein SCO4226-like
MPKFIIEREIPGASKMTEEDVRDIALKSLQALKELGPGIQWIHSFLTDDKIYCIYYAPDKGTIQRHARLAGIPADRVEAVRRLVDPSNFE